MKLCGRLSSDRLLNRKAVATQCAITLSTVMRSKSQGIKNEEFLISAQARVQTSHCALPGYCSNCIATSRDESCFRLEAARGSVRVERGRWMIPLIGDDVDEDFFLDPGMRVEERRN